MRFLQGYLCAAVSSGSWYAMASAIASRNLVFNLASFGLARDLAQASRTLSACSPLCQTEVRIQGFEV
jgi:hypothetical protein